MTENELNVIFLNHFFGEVVTKRLFVHSLDLTQALLEGRNGWRCSTSENEIDAILLKDFLSDRLSKLFVIHKLNLAQALLPSEN